MMKPIKKAGTPSIFKYFQTQGLSQAAYEIVLGFADIKSEGYVNSELTIGDVYSGSSMVTVDINSLFSDIKIPSKRELIAKDLLKHLKQSIPFRLSLMRLARREAEQRSSLIIKGTLETELEFNIVKNSILIDIDICGSVLADDNAILRDVIPKEGM
ncbi:MAG: hypothetical protein JXR91_17525 [Deltaproteobacteria bacterium]|nr:hypothetical protein [Deltaproteobacteria bacterium]